MTSGCLVLAGAAACAPGTGPDSGRLAGTVASPTTALPAASAPPSTASRPTTASSPAAAPSDDTSSGPSDLTQDAAGRFAPASSGASAPSAATSARGVKYADPRAVAQGYVGSRLTYRSDDLAGYTAALTSPAFTTPAFAARSRPSASALARLATSRQTSTVKVGGAELEGEAPNSDRARYVVVACTVTTTYRGGGDTAPAAWTVRLRKVAPGQWRVDGVLSTD